MILAVAWKEDHQAPKRSWDAHQHPFSYPQKMQKMQKITCSDIIYSQKSKKFQTPICAQFHECNFDERSDRLQSEHVARRGFMAHVSLFAFLPDFVDCNFLHVTTITTTAGV